jgi:hypothetical protein
MCAMLAAGLAARRGRIARSGKSVLMLERVAEPAAHPAR